MKAMKISVFAFTLLLLFTLADSVVAVSISFTELKEHKYEDKKKLKFNFLAVLQDDLYGLPTYWSAEINWVEDVSNGSLVLKDSVLIAGNILDGKNKIVDTDPFISNSITAEPPEILDGKLTFLGEFDPTGLTSKDSGLWSIFLEFSTDSKSISNDSPGYISGIDPDKLLNSSAPVPEPATMMLVGAGLLCMTAVRRKTKK